jgi:hypothetical protein
MTDVELIRTFLANQEHVFTAKERMRIYALADHYNHQLKLTIAGPISLSITQRYVDKLIQHLPVEERVAYKLMS